MIARRLRMNTPSKSSITRLIAYKFAGEQQPGTGRSHNGMRV